MAREVIELKGLEDTAKAFNKLGGTKARRRFASVMRRSVEPLYDSALGKIPVGLTGQMAEKLKIRVKKPDRFGISTIIITNPTIPRKKRSSGGGRLNSYAAFVEYGTRYQPAQSFMRSALEETGTEVIKKTESEILKQIEKVFK